MKVFNHNCTIIAEIGVNYYDIAQQMGISPLEAAKVMCREAKESGADYVKFQTYKAGLLAAKASVAYWDTREEPSKSQYELFKKFDSFGKAEYTDICGYCNEIGIGFMSTPFDLEAVKYIDALVKVHKISSSDITNYPLIEAIAKCDKPIVISAGASDKAEIDNALCIIRKYNNREVALMHCVLEYPTVPEHANLGRIKSLREIYPDYVIGYSDHTKPDEGYEILATAFNLGATVIEKHFTLDKTLKGNDHYHAMDAADLKKIREKINYVSKITGCGGTDYLASEKQARLQARRSVVAGRKISAGEIIQYSSLIMKRPGTGISPSQLDKVIGKSALIDIDEDTIITEDMIE